MATRTTTFKVLSGQPERDSRAGSVLVEQPAIAQQMNMPSAGRDAYWGDRIAFKIWLICFLFMALMVVFNTITALVRGNGSP